MEHVESQVKAIKAHLEKGHSITGMKALELFGCWCLPRRICDLKERGVAIESQWIKTPSNKRIKEYWIANEE